MKLAKLHLFLIMVAVLVASTLGFSVKEYFENNVVDQRVGQQPNTYLDKGSNVDPFGNAVDAGRTTDNYGATVAELEGIVVPGRRERREFNDNGDIASLENEYSKDHVDRNKYILKSEIVPPVCPKCPDAAVCPRQKPCPACPPCARCPEPAFECKKVPKL